MPPSELTADVPDGLTSLALRQAGSITVEQVLDHVTTPQLTRLVAGGGLVRLWRGAYALAGRQSEVLTRLRAADLTYGSTVVACLHTTAELYNFDIAGDAKTHVLTMVPGAHRHGNLVPHRNLITAPLERVSGRPTTNPAEAAMTIASMQPNPPRALAVLDAALRSGAVASTSVLTEHADRLSVNRIRRTRLLIPWADGRAESPPESWLRWVFLDAGLPPPVPQHWVITSSGRRYRLDLAWPSRKVACEYDGVAFHTGAALFDDRQRLNDLTGDGWRMTFATASMVWTGRPSLIAQTMRLLEHPAA